MYANIPIAHTKAYYDHIKEEDYQKLLQTDLADPLYILNDGWLDEKVGMKY